MKALGVLLLLASCAPPAVPSPPPPAIPGGLTACQVAVPGENPPRLPRTPEALFAWGQRAEQHRADTARRLDECRDRLTRLGVWAEQQLGNDGHPH